MLQELQWLDLAVLGFFNGFAGRWHDLDLVLAQQQDDFLISGILFMAGFVWFWFEPGPAQHRRRSVIVNMVPAVFVALVLNRMIAVALPFRVRPMYDAAIPFINPHVDGVVHYNMENWSSFPSDTATYLFTMVAAFWLVSRPVGILAALYSVLFLAATRIYLGVHYPGDILAGAVLGFVTMLALQRILRDALARRALEVEARCPHGFYALGFLLAYEVGITFMDIRLWQHGLLVRTQRMLQSAIHASPVVALLLGGTAAAALGTLFLFRWRARRHLPRRDPLAQAHRR